MLRKFRILFSAIMLIAITLLFLDSTGTLYRWLGWTAKIQFLPAVLAINSVVVSLVLFCTLWFGRVYCSVVCPLGIFQDIFSWLGKFRKKNRFSYAKPSNWVRYAVLVLFVVMIVLGFNALAMLVAPYSLYGRMVSQLFHPVAAWATAPVMFVVVAVSALLIAFLAFFYGRMWCNTVCPVGSLLSLISRYSIFVPAIDVNKCNGCTKCARNCKAMCINPEEHAIDYSRCVVCMDCIDNCNQGAISFGRRKSNKVVAAELSDKGAERRKILSATAAVAVASTVSAQEKRFDGGLAAIEQKTLPKRNVPLKPFGSVGLKNFTNYCSACQLCVTECPSHILRPSTDLKTFMQPELQYDVDYCRTSCVRCSEVCPAGAIKPITAEEKTAISIGYAVVLPHNCLEFRGETCGMCARKCPVAAISMVQDPATGYRVPSVNENRCIGCGACEYYCPSRPIGAIYVEGREHHTHV